MSQKRVKTNTLEPLILLGLETFFTKNHILALPLAKKEVISNHAEETSQLLIARRGSAAKTLTSF